jgi:hypothetical protein
VKFTEIAAIGTEEHWAFVEGTDPGIKRILSKVYPTPEFDLRSWRMSVGMPTRELAKRLGVSSLDVARMENGSLVPSVGWDSFRRILCQLEGKQS